MDKHRFVEIGAVETVRRAGRAAGQLRSPVLVFGEAGLGKTEALLHVAKECRAAYFEATQYRKTVKALYRSLVDAYRIRTNATQVYDLSDILFSNLRSSQAEPLFVDEYQTIPPMLLRELLHIQERCNLTLVLAGNTDRLASTKATAGALDQIYSRIGMWLQIPRPSRFDWTRIGVAYNVEGLDAYDALAEYGNRTSLRMAGQLLNLCLSITGGTGSIKLAELKAAVRAKHGDADALKLLNPAIAA